MNGMVGGWWMQRESPGDSSTDDRRFLKSSRHSISGRSSSSAKCVVLEISSHFLCPPRFSSCSLSLSNGWGESFSFPLGSEQSGWTPLSCPICLLKPQLEHKHDTAGESKLSSSSPPRSRALYLGETAGRLPPPLYQSDIGSWDCGVFE